MYLGLSLSQSLLSLSVSLFLAFSFSLASTNTRYTIPTNRSLCQLFEPFQWHSHTTFSQPHSPTCFTHFIQSLSLSFTKSIPTFLYTAIELFSRMWWRLILGPKWEAVVFIRSPKNYTAQALQLYIHVWLLGRSSCSSPSTKVLNDTAFYYSLSLSHRHSCNTSHCSNTSKLQHNTN